MPDQSLLALSLASLSSALPPRIEVGMPWLRDQGHDDNESPSLIHAAAQAFGGQRLLCGEPAEVDSFLDAARGLAEARVIAFWLRESTFFANDGGLGVRSLARSWADSEDPLKQTLHVHAEHLVDPANL